MELALEIIICVLTLVVIGLLVYVIKHPASVNVKDDIDSVKKDLIDELSRVKRDINESTTSYLNIFKDSLKGNFDDLSKLLQQNLDVVGNNVKENTKKVEENLEKINKTLSESISKLQDDNHKKLDEMEKVVNEKLDSTLNARLTQSFKMVQENLQNVEKGLGEMRNLAQDVGGLQKVLSNVKTRGIWGEMQLSQILSELLTKDQYAENVITKHNSKDPVEFAVKLPNEDRIVYLPIDSKFPLDAYRDLVEAYEASDKDRVEACQKVLKGRITKFADDINSKYIDVPYTTDFAVMFLPVEGLYAEVAKSGLIEELQNNKRIIIAGPTTMSALLNSLQVGFRTLAIEKRSSEVWDILGAVKTEFGKFGDALKKAQKKINEAGNEIEELVGRRTNVIQRKLKNVTELDMKESAKQLELSDDFEEEDL